MSGLRIEIKIDPTSRFIETVWIDGDATIRRVPTALHENQLRDFRTCFGTLLQEAKNKIGISLSPSWDEIDGGVRKLLEAGNLLINQLFPMNSYQVINHWKDFVALRKKVVPTAPHELTLVSSETGRNFGGMRNQILPFEFLPFFKKTSSRPPVIPKISNIIELENALQNFIGYRCVINRVLASAGEQTCRDQTKSPSPEQTSRSYVKFFTCRTLKGANKEEQRLRNEHRRTLSFDAWPKSGSQGTADKLVELLWKVNHSSGRRKRPFGDQIHHFATHFDTSSALSEQHTIKLAGCKKSAFKVTLRDLKSRLGEWGSIQQIPNRDSRPLIFVNACGSSKVDPNGIASLPEIFLCSLRSRGFIGVETTVSDQFAVEFASEFYNRLVKGASIGKALFDSRRSLLQKFNNPLGFMYTCYADPDQKLYLEPNTSEN